MDQFAKETLPVSLEEEMRRSYLDYAMSVIVGRALPDVRDGLKPVHRRVLFAMHESNNVWNRPYVKCARVVVRGARQVPSARRLRHLRGPGSHGAGLLHALSADRRQGNFGSIDGRFRPPPTGIRNAAWTVSRRRILAISRRKQSTSSRTTTARAGTSVLPTKVPNLLINGSSGIAVGMATNIPPHNLGEVVDACLALLKKPDSTVDDLIKLMPAPDFPTAGINLRRVRRARRATAPAGPHPDARTHALRGRGEGQSPVDHRRRAALPGQQETLLERIAELVNDKKIEGIAHVQDEPTSPGCAW